MPPHKPQRRACRGRRKLGLFRLRGKLNTTNHIQRCCAHLLLKSKDLAENAETFIGKIETLRIWSRQTTEQRALRKHVVLREIIGNAARREVSGQKHTSGYSIWQYYPSVKASRSSTILFICSSSLLLGTRYLLGYGISMSLASNSFFIWRSSSLAISKAVG
jgi:hypothetical protein